MDPGAPVLQLTDLRAGYGAGTVLHGVDLEIPAGRVHVVVGDNGAGKTTLLHTVAGLLRPAGGQIRFDGREITALPAHRRARAGIALVPQGRRVFATLTVAEHLAIAARRRPRPGRRLLPGRRLRPGRPPGGTGWSTARVLELLPQLGARLRHRGGQLSGGEQQMLAIARALLAQPRLLLLDEPTEGLSPALAGQIRDLIGTLSAGGQAILLAAPQADLPAAVADRVTVLAAGHATAVPTGADPGRWPAAPTPAETTPDRPALPSGPGAGRSAWADILSTPGRRADPTRTPIRPTTSGGTT